MTHDTLAPWAERVPGMPERMSTDELLPGLTLPVVRIFA
jgi:hypothetical protein